MSDLLKLFLKIFHMILYDHCDTNKWPIVGLDVYILIEMLVQRCGDVNCEVLICFIFYEKALDMVHHLKLINILRKVGIYDKDVRIIANLYWK